VFGIRGALQAWSDSGAKKEADAFLSVLQVADDGEASLVLAGTAAATKLLRVTRHVSRPLPEKLLNGQALVVSPKDRASVSAYLLELISVHNTLCVSEKPRMQLVAPGVAVLMHSLRAVSRGPEFLVNGRLIWRELMRGLALFPETYREAFKPAATAEEVSAALYVPRMLVPHEGRRAQEA
jgi:hypothetical protein